jgi:hypothetical protein
MTPLFNDRTALKCDPKAEAAAANGEDRALETIDASAHSATVDPRPKLLVSVRDPSEISVAMAAGIDIIDLKEPWCGALAPADVELWRYAASLADQLGSSHSPQLSAALGERSEAVCIASQLPGEFAFAKVGPSGCNRPDRVRQLWSEVDGLLDNRIEFVAVAYADADRAQCLPADAIFREAIDAGIRRCLIDTFGKDGRSTLDHLGIEGLKQLDDVAREGDLWWALAGSIDTDCVSQLWAHGVQPHCFGVRGDVCDRGRTGTLSNDRISKWKESLGM